MKCGQYWMSRPYVKANFKKHLMIPLSQRYRFKKNVLSIHSASADTFITAQVIPRVVLAFLM